jgi:hypothetical protein
MGAGAIAAGLGATVFAFSLPSLAQFNHCQVVYRCCVPLAMLYLWEGLRNGSARNLLLSAFWLCAQMLISVRAVPMRRAILAVSTCGANGAVSMPLPRSRHCSAGLCSSAGLIVGP